MSEINTFGEAAAAALASAEATSATPETPVEGTPEVVATPETPETPAAPEVPEWQKAKHKVKVRGDEQEVEYDELLKGYSRQADYTRSKQELAEQARAVREFQESLTKQQETYKQLFDNDPLLAQARQVAEHYKVPLSQAFNAVVEYQRSQGQATPQQPEQDEIATVAQARALAQRELATVHQQLQHLQRQLQEYTQKEVATAKSEIQTTQQANEYAQEVSSTLSNVFTKHPILGAVENMEDVLRFKVAQADPATIEEAKDLFVKFAEEQAERLTRQFTELNKSRVAAKEKLVTGGIEPPGGAGVTPQPRDYTLGSSDLRNAATDYLNSMLKG